MANNVKNIRWAFNVTKWSPTEREWGLAMALIQAEERERIAKFRYRVDMVSSLVGRLMLRSLAVSVFGLRNTEAQFERTERGKPVLSANQRPESSSCDHSPPIRGRGWDYNVSHAGDWVVLAAAEEARLGVDVMRTRDSRVERLEEFFRLMRRQFTDQEWVTINGGKEDSDETRLERFFRHWTLKESYVKAVGTGLNIDLRTLNFKLSEPSVECQVISSTKLEVDEEITSWLFEESILDKEHAVSVAVDGSSPVRIDAVKFEVLNIDQIFELMSLNIADNLDEQLLRPVDPCDFATFCSKDHPKPF